MSVTREEFEALTVRVAALENITERTWSMIGHLDVGLREVNEKVDRVEVRLNDMDRKLDQIIGRLS